MRFPAGLVVVVCSALVTSCAPPEGRDSGPTTTTPGTRTLSGRFDEAAPLASVRALVDGEVVVGETNADRKFTLVVPRDEAAVLEVMTPGDNGLVVIGDVAWPRAVAPASDEVPTESTIVVRSVPRSTSTLLPGNEDIWLGDVAVWVAPRFLPSAPSEGGARVETACASPSLNPLAHNDHDGDGVADIEDADASALLPPARCNNS